MPRIALNCRCGWNFFIPDSTQGSEVPCPSCGEGVRVPGRKPGQQAMAPGLLAAAKARQQQMTRLLIGVGAAIVVVGVVLVIVLMSGGSSDDAADAGPRPNYGIGGMGESSRSSSAGDASSGRTPEKRVTSPKDSPRLTDFQVADHKRGIEHNVWLLNVAGVASEVLRLRGSFVNEYERLQSHMAGLEGKIQHSLNELATNGEKMALEPYMLPQDRILTFSQKDLTGMKPLDAAALLNDWLGRFKAGLLEQVVVQRGPSKLTLYFHFKEETKELLQMARLPMNAVADAGSNPTALPSPSEIKDPPPAADAGPLPLPDALVKQITSGFDGLPPGYRQILPADDRQRVDTLLKSGKGTAEDVEYLKTRVAGDLLSKCEQEAALCRAKVAELEAKAKEQTSVDTILFKDGRKVEGKVEEETEEHVKIKSRFGSVKVLKADIQRIDRGKGAGVQFPDKYKEAAGKVDKLQALLAWCKENNLRLERELVAYVILTLDASNDRARTEAGLPRVLGAAGGTFKAAPGSDAPLRAQNDAVVKAVDGIAADVLRRHSIFTDVVTEMRRLTESFRYSLPATVPAKSNRVAALIGGNPLTFQPNDLTVQAAMEIGNWWGALGADDRKDFARYFGLACAYQRHLQGK
jgi:hypothetical protein